MIHIGCPTFILDTSAPFQMRLLSFPPLGHLLMNLVPPSHKQVDEFATMVGEDLSDLPEMVSLKINKYLNVLGLYQILGYNFVENNCVELTEVCLDKTDFLTEIKHNL
jgi:hypothetical protein